MKNSKKEFVIKPTSFDYVNSKAEIVIVGITPGNDQIKGSRDGLDSKEIKRQYAFDGKTRKNLIKMLDYIGINTILNIQSCKSLWDTDVFDKVEFTSLLKNATFHKSIDGKEKMFKEVEDIEKYSELKKEFEDGFLKDCDCYRNAKLFVACGNKVYNKLVELKNKGVISSEVIGIAHPSNQNIDRIGYYIGDETYSFKWCRDKAKEAREIVSTFCI